MTPTVPTTEPTEFFQNTTVKWTKSFADYPATTYTLKYYLLHTTPANNKTITAAASGTDFAITIPYATTATYTAGTYKWISVMETATEKFSIGEGEFIVKADPAGVATARVLTHNQTVLANINSVIEGTASTDVLNYTIGTGAGSRSLGRRTYAELLELKSEYEAKVKAEATKIEQSQGVYKPSTIRGSFGRIS